MRLLRPESLEDAAAALRAQVTRARALAGGTELVPLLKDHLVEAETLVDLGGIVPRGVRGTRIGAGTTLAELERSPDVPRALREACRLAASPQVRAMGTIGGNLLQATRCWYWRLRFPCWLHGGDRCLAKAGAHREHAVFGNERCASAHPSDVAAALVALGARVQTTERELTVEELYRLPTDDDRDTTALRPGELLLELDVPEPAASTYLKAMDRRAFSFPLVGVAAARTGGETRLALAGVAPIPWSLGSADELETATPLPQNAYKLELARALIGRALAEVEP